MNYVYSTLSCDNTYAIYAKADKNQPVHTIAKRILIKGGANVSNKALYTPLGVATQVSDEDLALLMDDSHFQQHMHRGFIRVEKSKKDGDAVAAKMTAKDNSAPKIKGDKELTANILDAAKPV